MNCKRCHQIYDLRFQSDDTGYCDDCAQSIAESSTEIVEALESMVRACGSGMNWMEMVDRAKISSATRGLLRTDIGMCSASISKARKLIRELKVKIARAE